MFFFSYSLLAKRRICETQSVKKYTGMWSGYEYEDISKETDN